MCLASCDVIDHPISHAKLSQFDLPELAMNRIALFLSYRTQLGVSLGVVSFPKSINSDIIQRSRIDPALYVIMMFVSLYQLYLCLV